MNRYGSHGLAEFKRAVKLTPPINPMKWKRHQLDLLLKQVKKDRAIFVGLQTIDPQVKRSIYPAVRRAMNRMHTSQLPQCLEQFILDTRWARSPINCSTMDLRPAWKTLRRCRCQRLARRCRTTYYICFNLLLAEVREQNRCRCRSCLALDVPFDNDCVSDRRFTMGNSYIWQLVVQPPLFFDARGWIDGHLCTMCGSCCYADALVDCSSSQTPGGRSHPDQGCRLNGENGR